MRDVVNAMHEWDMDSDNVRDNARSQAFDRASAAFALLMSVCADLDPTDVALDLVETFIQDRAHRTRPISEHDLMAFIASRDEMPVGRDEPREIDSPAGVAQHDDDVLPMSSFIGRRVRLSLDDPNGTHTMTGTVVDVDDTRLLLNTRRRNKPIPTRFIRTITLITKAN